MTTHPVITNDVAMLSYLLHLEGSIDAELLQTSLFRIDRNSGPWIVSELFRSGCLTDLDVLAVGVAEAWTGAEFPMSALDVDEWVEMFEVTGYLVNNARRPDLLPKEPMTLYRGASTEDAYGWSWTDDVEQARWFANRPILHNSGRVFVAEVAPHRILAHFPEARDEAEYVVDALALSIRIAS